MKVEPTTVRMFLHNWQHSLQLHEDFKNRCIKQAGCRQIIVPSRAAACHAPKPCLHIHESLGGAPSLEVSTTKLEEKDGRKSTVQLKTQALRRT